MKKEPRPEPNDQPLFAVIETPDAVFGNVAFVEPPALGMFVLIPLARIRAELAACASVQISFGLGYDTTPTREEVELAALLRTRPRCARLVPEPGLGDFMRVEWLLPGDVVTAVEAAWELELLAAGQGGTQ